jgi:PilZ domain-containing protein
MDRRRKRRVEAQLPVRVWGMDAKTQPFTQTAMVNNISRSGARLEGMQRMLKPGEFIHVQLGADHAQFRVVWAGKVGTQREGEVGLEGVASEPLIWDVNFVRCSEFVGEG